MHELGDTVRDVALEETGGDREMMEMKGCLVVELLPESGEDEAEAEAEDLDSEVTSILEKFGGSGGGTGGGLSVDSWDRDIDVELSGVGTSDGCSS